MLDPGAEFLYDLLSVVVLEAAQTAESPGVLIKEKLMKKTFMGMLISDL